MEVVGSTVLQGHHQNLKPQATGAGSRGQPGVTKPRSDMTKAVPKTTVETEQGSQQEGDHTGPVGGEPDPNPEKKQDPPGREAIKNQNAQEREPQVKVGDPPPSGAGASPPVHLRPPRKPLSKSSGLREDRTRTRDRGARESQTTTEKKASGS